MSVIAEALVTTKYFDSVSYENVPSVLGKQVALLHFIEEFMEDCSKTKFDKGDLFQKASRNLEDRNCV